MTSVDFQALRDRIERCYKRVHLNADPGYSSTYQASDGTAQTIRVVGLKSPALLEDDLLCLFVWIWSMKDYLKELCRLNGTDPQTIERIANTEPALTIAADIANRVKHGVLRDSRSGRHARLTKVGIETPGADISSITVKAFEVEIVVANPETATLCASIEFASNDPPLDAFNVLNDAISAWESRAFPITGV